MNAQTRREIALQDELERVRLLYRIGRQFDSQRDTRSVLRGILREAVRAMRASSGSVALIDHNAGVLVIEVAVNIDPKAQHDLRLKVGQGVTGQAAKLGKVLRVNDVTRNRRYVSLREGVLSEMAVPLIVEGQTIGVLNVDADRLNAFSQADEDLLVAAAAEAARVIHFARLHEQIRDQSAKLESLYRVGQTLTSAMTLDEALNRIADEVRHVMGARVCSIQLLNESGDSLEIQAVSGATQAYSRRPPQKVGEVLIGRVVTQRQPLAVRDVRKAPGFRALTLARREGLCSLLSVPIEYLDRAIGVLNIYTGEPKEFEPGEIRLLQALAGQSAVAIVNARRSERAAQAEEQLRQAEKLSVLGALAAEIAHEIRNPITIIQMLIDSLAADIPDGDARSRDADVIKAKLQHMDRIIDQVLDVARAREQQAEPVDVHQVIEDILFLTQRRLSASSIELHRKLAANSPKVVGDRVAIEQALLNLVLNACQAMPHGGKLTVATKVVANGGQGAKLAIRIGDTGPGIEPAKVTQIFKPFFTTRREGVGMGLFIARRILREHRGDLKVKTTLGKGSTFEATLPLE